MRRVQLSQFYIPRFHRVKRKKQEFHLASPWGNSVEGHLGMALGSSLFCFRKNWKIVWYFPDDFLECLKGTVVWAMV